MRRRVGVFGIGVVLAIGAAVVPRQPPDFSGTWTASADAPVFGPQLSIRQDGQSLTLSRTFGGLPATITYTLDGSETTSRMPGRLCQPDSGATWAAAWEGSAITLTMLGALPANGKPVKMNVKSTLRMESADVLRVEVSATPPGQSAPRLSSTTYKRVGPAPAALAPAPKTRATIDQVAWIAGEWTGTSGATTFEERWTPAAGGSMIAISRTLRDGLMSAFEFLCIVERDGGLVYVAMPNGRIPATDFTMTTIDANSVLFENPAHDFPKMIRYSKRADGGLEATIAGAGGQKPQTFVFTRRK